MIRPKVTVCLTAFNRAARIGRSIESLLSQDFGDFELIISDDASEDSTEEVCREYQRRDPRVLYVRNERNLGMPGNLNSALTKARAPLVANLHDGDTFRPDLLRLWKDALERNPDAAFAFCQCDVLDEEGRWVSRRAPELPQRLETKQLVAYMTSSEHCYNSPVWGTVMGRSEAYRSLGFFDPRFSFVADVAMWIRLNLRYPVLYVREPLIELTPHEQDRPYAYVNWSLERAITAMYEEAIDCLYAPDPVAVARERRRIRRIRDRRWLWAVGSCFRRGRLDLVQQGLAVLREEDSVRLKVAGYGGVPLLALRRRYPRLQKVVELADFLIRGRRP